MMKKEDIQRSYMEYQLIDQQLKVFRQQLTVLEQQSSEIIQLVGDLENLKSTKPKTKAYAQIGPGIAIEATLDETSHVLMNVGSQTLVRKTLPEVQKMLQEQVEEIRKIKHQLEEDMAKLVTHANMLREEIQKSQQK